MARVGVASIKTEHGQAGDVTESSQVEEHVVSQKDRAPLKVRHVASSGLSLRFSQLQCRIHRLRNRTLSQEAIQAHAAQDILGQGCTDHHHKTCNDPFGVFSSDTWRTDSTRARSIFQDLQEYHQLT